MKLIFLITSIVLTLSINVYSQVVNCSRCRGTGKETIQSPYECQNCKNWNTEYRRKVACNVCRDTRVNPNIKSWTETCSSCNGSGRDYKQEQRNKEFGSKEFKILNSIYSGILTASNLEFRSLELEYRDPNINAGFDGIREKWTWNESSDACSCLGNEWRWPTKDEIKSIYDYLYANNLRKDRPYDYWTSTRSTRYSTGVWKFNLYNGIGDDGTPGDKREGVLCVKRTLQNSTLTSASSGGLRDPQRKDVANVFWNGNYPLYSLVDDLEIKPDASGIYRMWYATNEDKTPRELIMTKGQVKQVYKFRTYEECLKWCRGY